VYKKLRRPFYFILFFKKQSSVQKSKNFLLKEDGVLGSAHLNFADFSLYYSDKI